MVPESVLLVNHVFFLERWHFQNRPAVYFTGIETFEHSIGIIDWEDLDVRGFDLKINDVNSANKIGQYFSTKEAMNQ